MEREKLQVLQGIVLIISIYVGFWILVGLVFWDFGLSGISILIEDMMDALVVLMLCKIAMRQYAMTPSEMAITLPLRWRSIALGLLIGMIIWFGAGVVSDLLKLVLPGWAMVPEKYNFVAQFAKSHGTEKILLLFVIGITTPLIEEVFLRGLIYSFLRRAFSVLGATIISSTLFGLGHIYLEAFVISFLIGCGLAWLRERETSLLGPMIAHSTVNSLSLIFFHWF